MFHSETKGSAVHNSVLKLAILAMLAACSSPDGGKRTFFSLLPTSERTPAPPANVPPPGFDGEFWVDREGCTYMRTGKGEWVPRMNIDRSRVCDPSLASSAELVANDAALGNLSGIAEPADFPAPEIIPESFVQVGRYAEPTNAASVRKQFADMGFLIFDESTALPDQGVSSVVLGPYTEQGFLNDALKTAQQMGFEDAYIFRY